MSFQIYDTMSRQERIFRPLRNKRVHMFVCGPTVYDLSHLGHARTYIAYDTIVKFLRMRGYSVFYLMNITDIDDKIIKRAQEFKVEPYELANKMTDEFLKDMEALKVNSINFYAKASHYIDEIIHQIKILLEKDFAYEVDGDVYYDITRFPKYGELSKQKSEELIKHRVDPNPKKRNPGDFALWKGKKSGEPSWESPWGQGRPGWHIEDTAITSTYFGSQYDVHGGALELIFPHHEAEIAQIEAITGIKPMVNFWIHTGLLTIKGKKMSKSLKNYVTIRDALYKYTPETLRVFFSMTHYRSPINYDEETVMKASKFALSINRTYKNVIDIFNTDSKKQDKVSGDLSQIKEYIGKFHKALEKDFNTPVAMSTIADFTTYVNKKLENKPSKDLLKAILNAYDLFDSVFGFIDRKIEDDKESFKHVIDIILRIRDALRREGQYQVSDSIRNKLKEAGIEVEDSHEKTKWRRGE